jgi:hypothetical protein
MRGEGEPGAVDQFGQLTLPKHLFHREEGKSLVEQALVC